MPVEYDFHGLHICPDEGRIGFCEDTSQPLPRTITDRKGPPSIDYTSGVGRFLISVVDQLRHAFSVAAAMTRNANIDNLAAIMTRNQETLHYASTMTPWDVNSVMEKVGSYFIPGFNLLGPWCLFGLTLYCLLGLLHYLLDSLVTSLLLIKVYGCCSFKPLLAFLGFIGKMPLIPIRFLGKDRNVTRNLQQLLGISGTEGSPSSPYLVMKKDVEFQNPIYHLPKPSHPSIASFPSQSEPPKVAPGRIVSQQEAMANPGNINYLSSINRCYPSLDHEAKQDLMLRVQSALQEQGRNISDAHSLHWNNILANRMALDAVLNVLGVDREDLGLHQRREMPAPPSLTTKGKTEDVI